MPIYEYVCESCGYKFEKMQGMNEPPLTDCEECHAHSLKKLVSAAGFRLKGSGWYETDFKTEDKKRNLASEESAARDATVSSSAGSADTGVSKEAPKETPSETPKETKKGETSVKNDSKAGTTE